jgi:hypothetical protein
VSDPIAETLAARAEYVRTVLPVVATYTRQVLVEVDLEKIRTALAADGDHGRVAWIDALILARTRFLEAERLAAMAESSPVVLTPPTPEGTAS